VAVDGAAIQINLVVISHIHQLIPTFHKAWALRQRLKQEKLGHRQAHILTLPTDRMAKRIHPEVPPLHHLGLEPVADGIARDRFLAPQQSPDAFHQKPLRKRFFN